MQLLDIKQSQYISYDQKTNPCLQKKSRHSVVRYLSPQNVLIRSETISNWISRALGWYVSSYYKTSRAWISGTIVTCDVDTTNYRTSPNQCNAVKKWNFDICLWINSKSKEVFDDSLSSNLTLVGKCLHSFWIGLALIQITIKHLKNVLKR